jgi:hypothetical protein
MTPLQSMEAFGYHPAILIPYRCKDVTVSLESNISRYLHEVIQRNAHIEKVVQRMGHYCELLGEEYAGGSRAIREEVNEYQVNEVEGN